MPSSPAPWLRSRSIPPRAAPRRPGSAAACCSLATVFLLEHARPLLLPVAIAIVFTFVLAAPVRALQRAGIHEYIGSALVITAVLSRSPRCC